MHNPTDKIAHTRDFSYTSHGALAEMRNSKIGPPRGIDPIAHRTMSRSFTKELHLAPCQRSKFVYRTVTLLGRTGSV